MTQYWLGLDCGGSWLKAGLYDREGREQACSACRCAH
ncbi:L-xylulose/3-keto-L-gulonate kinase [Escherichia coli]|uniref:L-xylulose/3-keto-L-gulonate kinase n=1 Tax=Escherichia coli TaxID=562 RepID=A0A376RAN9_ECOLX|nr:L-xylulose/3-keto-L-gulonate kinase [Escherichia coli]